MSYYPLNLNIAGKRCLVIGGGNVAWRKVRSLLGCEANVTVISPEVVPEIALLAGRNQLVWEKRGYRSGDVAGAMLVFAATDNPDVQRQVGLDAADQGILLNSADDPERCDFQVPAQVRRGELLLTVSTGGGSPAISRVVRQRLEGLFGLEYGELIYLFAMIREKLVPGPTGPGANRKMFRELLESNMLELVRDRQWRAVGEILERVLPAGLESAAILQRLVEFVDGGEAVVAKGDGIGKSTLGIANDE